VSRGGLKLRHALDVFGRESADGGNNLDVRGLTCADLGCSTGGFTDCLLQAGAAKVYAVDTAYGELAWKLRNDPRVVVMERSNALHATAPEGGVDLVVADIGWTPQRLVVPTALRWLKPGGKIVSLIKPHYEKSDRERAAGGKSGSGPGARCHVLSKDEARAETERVVAMLPSLGVRVLGLTESPILGGKGTKEGTGNLEWLVMTERA
jgi:23S rRNA (cytidine1920-2'-O)/16S rRNA (cytidine1409-2'-O)-methyltransferase